MAAGHLNSFVSEIGRHRIHRKTLTWRKTLSRSKGAVPDRDTAPATAPAISCLHTYPDFFSSSENSSGTVSCSPISSIYSSHRRMWIKHSSFLSNSALSKCSYQWALPVARHLLHVAQRIEQEVVSPFIPVNGHGAIFIYPEQRKNKLILINAVRKISPMQIY